MNWPLLTQIVGWKSAPGGGQMRPVYRDYVPMPVGREPDGTFVFELDTTRPAWLDYTPADEWPSVL